MKRADAQGWFRRKAGWRPSEILFWAACAGSFFVFPDYLSLLSQMAIMGLFVLSLDLLLGYGGVVSLGHAAFFGIGAFTAGLLAKHGWGEPLSGLAAAGAVAALMGYASSFMVLRGNDLTRLLVTLGISMMLFEAANKAAWLTGGSDGLTGIQLWPVLGQFRFDLYGKTAFCYSLAVLFLSFLVARRLVHSPYGLGLRGIKENVRRMPALGAPVSSRLVSVYTISACFAGIAGGLLTQTTEFVSQDVLGFHRSAEVLLVLVLGGTGHLYGALIGAVVFMAAHHILSDITTQYWQFWMGAAFVLVVLFARGGIMGLLIRVNGMLRRKPAEGEGA